MLRPREQTGRGDYLTLFDAEFNSRIIIGHGARNKPPLAFFLESLVLERRSKSGDVLAELPPSFL